MEQYIEIGKQILEEGEWKDNRTGIPTLSITGAMFKHDMRKGFPLLTTKKMAIKTCFVELEGFIKGITNKKWYQDRGCHIWDQWCNPQKVPYGHDKETQQKMLEEDDLGRIYSYQWRNWNGNIDQLQNVISTLRKNPLDRRMIVSAWNPSDIHMAALPSCHYAFQFLSNGKELDLLWSQRSVDTPLGLPFNIASYGMLLILVSKMVNMVPRMLIGQLADVHVYKNQLEAFKEQLEKEPYELPKMNVPVNGEFDLFKWEHTQFDLSGYKSHPKIKFPIAI